MCCRQRGQLWRPDRCITHQSGAKDQNWFHGGSIQSITGARQGMRNPLGLAKTLPTGSQEKEGLGAHPSHRGLRHRPGAWLHGAYRFQQGRPWHSHLPSASQDIGCPPPDRHCSCCTGQGHSYPVDEHVGRASIKAHGERIISAQYDKNLSNHSTRVIVLGLKPRSASLPLRARAARALLRLRISRVSSRTLPPRPMPSMRTLRL